MKTPHRKLFKTALLTLAMLLAFQSGMSAPSGQKASQVMELMQEGSADYLRRDYRKAIGPYQKALDLEKQKRTLDRIFGVYWSTISACPTASAAT